MTLPRALAVLAGSFLLASLLLQALHPENAPAAASGPPRGIPAASSAVEDRRDPVSRWLDDEWFACLDRGGRLTYPLGCTK